MAITMDKESRFSHLLQPIRDLAENWSIDLATELEEYLAELESVTFAFDGIGKTLNFAEAALLIQGSACIYSKKVEYLYSLVYQTLDFLVEKRKKGRTPNNDQLPNSIGPDGIDKDVVVVEEPEFLLLDDIQEADGIDLPEDENNNDRERAIDNGFALNFGPSLLCRTPLPLLRAKLGDAAQSADAGSGLEGVSKRTEFRMNTCAIHKSGALLLGDHATLACADESLRGDATDAVDTVRSLKSTRGTPPSIDGPNVSPLSTTAGPSTASPPHPPSDSSEPADIHAVGDVDDDDNEPDHTVVVDAGIIDNTSVPSATMHSNSTSRAAMLASLPALTNVTGAAAAVTAATSPAVTVDRDPWEPLDPHIPVATAQPFRKGKTYRAHSKEDLAKLLSTSTSAEVLRAALDGTVGQKRKAEPVAETTQDSKTGKNKEDPWLREAIALMTSVAFAATAASLKTPCFADFGYLYERAFRKRQSAWKKEIAAFRRAMSTDSTAPQLLEEAGYNAAEIAAAAADGIDANVIGANVDIVDRLMAAELGENSHAVGGVDIHVDDNAEDDDELPEPIALDEPAAGEVVQSYEDLCRAHIETYLTSAQQYVQETSISRRVTEWRERLEPVLQAQEKRPPFDIRVYGDSLMARFAGPPSEGPITTFADLITDAREEPPEVCRRFFALLQLANNGNVEIIRDTDADHQMSARKTKLTGEDIKVKLLTTEPRYDLDNYRAPSLEENEGEPRGKDSVDTGDIDNFTSEVERSSEDDSEEVAAVISVKKPKHSKKHNVLVRNNTGNASNNDLTKQREALGPVKESSKGRRGVKRRRNEDESEQEEDRLVY